MKSMLAILLATVAVALGIGGGSSGLQNAPEQTAPQAAPPQQIAPSAAPSQQPIQVFIQQPQPVPATAPAQGSGGQSQSTAPAGGSNFLGKDVPFFDPGSNIVTWDGKSWNINNNALFQARFEKYLNAPPATTPDNRVPGAPPPNHGQALARQDHARSIDEAFQLLAKASRYQEDANLCDSIANQVYSAWLARKNNDRLNAASKSLEDERKRLEWNAD